MSDKIKRNIPDSLKAFHDVLMGFRNRHDLSTVLSDYLSLHLQAWSREKFADLNEYCQKRYTDQERGQLGELIKLYTLAMKEGIDQHEWFDGIGTYYEAFASEWKKQGLGQFFTPPAVCDIMSQFVIIGKPQGKLISEPACGSGRNVISLNKHAPRNYYHAQDVDPMCVKMTALNMLHHGIEGVVFCEDTLKMHNFRFAYGVNMEVHFGGPPSIVLTENKAVADSYWRSFETRSRFIADRAEEPQEVYLAA